MPTKLQGSIQLAAIRFLDRREVKLRPVVVLNEPVGPYQVVLVAPIYSKTIDHKLSGDVEIHGDFGAVGLLRPSTVRLHRMVALPAADLKKQLGSVNSRIEESIKLALRGLFGL